MLRIVTHCQVWKRGLTWMGTKAHMGSNQEAYDLGCTAFVHALEKVAERNISKTMKS